jgi:hypothetical protein
MMTFKEFIAKNSANKKAPQKLKGSRRPELVASVRSLLAKKRLERDQRR